MDYLSFLPVLSGISFVTTVLLLWFKTNFIKDYADLLGINVCKWLDIADGGDLFVYDLLAATTNPGSKIKRFFLKLSSCPFCMAFWISLLTPSFFITYVFSLLLFFLFEKIAE